MLSIEIKKDKIKTISWVVFIIICFKELVGKNPPDEITVIERLSPLKSLIPEIENSIKIKKVNEEYKKNILKEIFLIFASGFKLFSSLKTSFVNL